MQQGAIHERRETLPFAQNSPIIMLGPLRGKIGQMVHAICPGEARQASKELANNFASTRWRRQDTDAVIRVRQSYRKTELRWDNESM